MTKLKQAAQSRKTIGNGLWLAIAISSTGAALSYWGTLKDTLSPTWWFVGIVAITAATRALHWWQGRA